MPRPTLKTKSQPEIDHWNAVLSLRWLPVMLGSYFILTSEAGSGAFAAVVGVALVFSLSNIALLLIPTGRYTARVLSRVLTILDVALISAVLYLMREPGNYLHVAFIALIVLTAVWRDVRLVAWSLPAAGVLFGVFTYYGLFGFERGDPLRRLLTLSLFFALSMLYVLLSDRLMQAAKMSAALIEESRLAEVMVEMTREVSSSLNTEDVLYSIVSRLREVLEADDCSILRIDPRSGAARIMKASKPDERNVEVRLDDYPELKRAYASRELLFLPAAKAQRIIAIPMLVNNSVLGLIEVRSARIGAVLTEANTRFLKVIASTAANALRNAQLFEEVEQRARTDFLTGLPNHRFFQATLTVEVGRAQRHNRTLSLLIVDLDFLKSVNDRFGHQTGDTVIRAVADIIRTTCREIDFPARYGGEEFTVILPDTPLGNAVQVAERLRESIAARGIPGVGNVTASIGVSNYPVNALNKADLIRVADEALYTAKNGGRDRVAHFTHQRIAR
jgi:diguanylate cyclase (GGDEF)-like protein